MCYYIDMDTHPEEGYVAEKDIGCYKVLTWRRREGRWDSPYFRRNDMKEWKPGVTQTSVLSVLPDTVYETRFLDEFRGWCAVRDVGSYPEPDPDWRGETRTLNLRMTYRGLYAFANYMNGGMKDLIESLMFSPLGRGLVAGVFRCFVPSGGRYCVDENSEVVVSSSLVLGGLAGIVADGRHDPSSGWFEVFPPDLENVFCITK